MREQEHERRVAEDPEQRNSRLQRIRESRRRQLVHPQVALFEQPAVRAKLLNFHSSISSIEVPVCRTCLDGFPGLNISSDECSRCQRDTSYSPKLHSHANNMDPGDAPLQLQVLESNNLYDECLSSCRA